MEIPTESSERRRGRSNNTQLATGAPSKWPLVLSVFIIHMILPSLVLSYGVILTSSAKIGNSAWTSFSSPAIYTVLFYMAQPWCREAADSWGGHSGYRFMGALGVLTIFVGVLFCTFIPATIQPIFYGAFGGLGNSLVSAQVDAVLFDTFDTRLSLVRGFCFFGQAIGQFILPHIILLLIETYGLPMSYLILSAMVFQTLPAALFLKVTETILKSRPNSRYDMIAKSYSLFNNDPTSVNYKTDLQLIDLSKKCWKSPSDDNLNEYTVDTDESFDNDNNYDNHTETPPPSPEERRKNIFGVEILPDIPEESETSYSSDSDNDSDASVSTKKKRYSLAIKRLSMMSDSFGESIDRANRKNSTNTNASEATDANKYTEIDVTYSNITPTTEVTREHSFTTPCFRMQSVWASFRVKRPFHFPSYRSYRMKRRVLISCYAFNDTFIKPLSRSLSFWRFYPALLLKCSLLSVKIVCSSLIPLLSYTMFANIPLKEVNFIVSLHAFSWLCFLLTTPWFTTLPRTKYKYFTVGGLFVTTIGTFIIAECRSHSLLAIGSVIVGFGYGAMSSTCEDFVREWIGLRKWSKVQGTLECLSAVCVGLFSIGCIFLLRGNNSVTYCFNALTILLTVALLVWCLILTVLLCLSSKDTIRVPVRLRAI